MRWNLVALWLAVVGCIGAIDVPALADEPPGDVESGAASDSGDAPEAPNGSFDRDAVPKELATISASDNGTRAVAPRQEGLDRG